MNNYTKGNIKFIIIAALVVGLVATVFAVFENQDRNHHQEMKDQLAESLSNLDEVRESASKQSDIEIIGQNLNLAKRNAKQNLEDIEAFRSKIVLLEAKYENNILSKRCLEYQVDSMTDDEVYSTEFCFDDSNLELFRTKKY